MKAANKSRAAGAPLLFPQGFALANAEALAADSPASFEIPALDERLRLSPGDCAKLIFKSADKAERMWVRVERRRQCGTVAHYRGTLANEPIARAFGLRFGSAVEFTSRHIIDCTKGAGDE
jgi:hypothetical protein